jgi:hypothetical protein
LEGGHEIENGNKKRKKNSKLPCVVNINNKITNNQTSPKK